MSTKYECIQNIDMFEIDDEWIIMDTKNFRVTKVNTIGAFILDGLKEQKRMKAIIETIAEDYAVDVNIVRSDAIAFLEELKGIGLIKDGRKQLFNS